MPAAPAPITTMSASRGNGAPQARLPRPGNTAAAADAARRSRRVMVMSGFRNSWQQSEYLVREFSNLPHPDMGGKHHGKSIMIDQPFA
jgi:hypothetical protein